MKLVLDERNKHRLIGLAVILSLAAIFAPAIMKKSAQRLDKDIGMHIQLPPKPLAPNVAAVDKQTVFKSIKIAHVKLPSEIQNNKQIQLTKVEPQALEKDFVPPIASLLKTIDVDTKPAKLIQKAPANSATVSSAKPVFLAAAQQAPKKVINTVVKKPMILALNQEIYSVQVASFGRMENAQILLNRLRAKGYIGKIHKISTRHGDQYKVYVGKSTDKNKALKLKNQLATSLQLNGFVVTGVS